MYIHPHTHTYTPPHTYACLHRDTLMLYIYTSTYIPHLSDVFPSVECTQLKRRHLVWPDGVDVRAVIGLTLSVYSYTYIHHKHRQSSPRVNPNPEH